MIYLGSRYADQAVDSVAERDQPVRQFVLRQVVPDDDPSLRVHLWGDSDRIDRVAQEYLGSPSSWWRIMDVNPHILDPNAIPVGTEVRIPDA